MNDIRYDAAAHYDAVTDAWRLLLGDELHYGVFDDANDDLAVATARLTALMAGVGRLAPGVDALDVGCGTGAPACFFARALGARVTGITTSAAGVDAATARAAAGGLGAVVTFLLRDGMDNGFPSTSFDRVVVLESSHLMRRRDSLVAECARVLRPGGVVVLCDIMRRRPIDFDEVRRLRAPLSLLRRVFGDARMEDLEWYAAAMTGQGLVVETTLDLTAATLPTFAKWRANATEHRDAVIERMGEASWRDFVESCDVLEGFWRDGTLGYGLLSATKPSPGTPVRP